MFNGIRQVTADRSLDKGNGFVIFRSSDLRNKELIMKHPVLYKWLAVMAVFLIVAVAWALWQVAFDVATDGVSGFVEMMLAQLPAWVCWGIAAVPVMFVTRWAPLKFNRALISGTVLTSGILGSLFLHAVLLASYIVVRNWITNEPGEIRAFWDIMVALHSGGSLLWRATCLVTLVIASYAFDYYALYTEREQKAQRLEEQLAIARLDALTMQIQPHFLYNTLTAIAELMHEDIDAADRMISRLGDLLRLTLDANLAHEVTLARELKFTEHYLEIETTRFGERLSVTQNVDPAALEALVPSLILQPLVENAVRHGISKTARKGEISLNAFKNNGRLTLEVHDNGNGLDPSKDEQVPAGVGLSNVRSRLRELYGNDFSFELSENEGVTATLSIPYKTT